MSLVKWMNGWAGRALRIVAGLDRPTSGRDARDPEQFNRFHSPLLAFAAHRRSRPGRG